MKQNVGTCSGPEGFSQVSLGRETGGKSVKNLGPVFSLLLTLLSQVVEGEEPQRSQCSAPCWGVSQPLFLGIFHVPGV